MNKATLYSLRNALVAVLIVCAIGIFFDGTPRKFTVGQGYWIILLAVGIVIACNSALGKFISSLKEGELQLRQERYAINQLQQRLTRGITQTVEERTVARTAWRERAMGLPTLLKTLDEYYESRDNALSIALTKKSHPALKAAEVVKAETRRRRLAEFVAKQAQATLEYYESIAPFLLEFKEEISVEEEENYDEWLREYDQAEREDAVTRYLAKTEYRKLTPAERNQLALDRYWQRNHATREVGRMYERFVGYWYESQQYSVEYNGIFRGFEDLGRDLICQRNDAILVVQCKNWSQAKTIHEKHIFQLYGSVFLYGRENPGRTVHGALITTTTLSDVARDAAEHLGIEVLQDFRMDKMYPCIKCNVARRTGEKIYHLPFDQQYDNVHIELHRGELYCRTVAEAESQGFRRAFRYRRST